jgi:hypothetical protein
MAYDRSQDRRQIAGECLVLARQTSDLSVRASLLDMAQKWLELASDQYGSHTLRDFFHNLNEQQLQDRPTP